MIEEEWQARSQFVAMLTHVHKAGCSDRKIRLAAVAVCRHLVQLQYQPEWHNAIELSEEWVEGIVAEPQLVTAHFQLQAITAQIGASGNSFYGHRAVLDLTQPVSQLGVLFDVKGVAWNANMAFGAGQGQKVRAAHCGIVREIFGNPFRPVAFDPAWRTSTAVSLARTMYESREFLAMPILADALQDAGCEHADVLGHCRDPQAVHVRGCWVVDLVLKMR
jgi:hypothetical protein